MNKPSHVALQIAEDIAEEYNLINAHFFISKRRNRTECVKIQCVLFCNFFSNLTSRDIKRAKAPEL